MVRIFFIILLFFSTSACTKTTFVRSAPDYSQSLTKSKIVLLLPPIVEVNQIDAFNKKTRVYSYEDRLEENIVDTFITKMQDKGYNIKLFSRTEIGTNKLSKYVVDIKDNFDETLNILYASGAWKEDAAYSIDEKISSAVDLGEKAGADLLVVMNFYAESKTSGAVTKDFCTEILKGCITGRVNLDPSEFSRVRLAILDVPTGRVLWTHSVGLSSDMIDTTIASFSDNDKVDKKNLSILFNSALADLPDAK
ncbi:MULTISPECIES: hypothetical protein [unclassified Candidatus Tisiphia]|jgi:hypothetical protein|uniref:hypothetical protein n=1 Tax=unclassified Candidatus Tisiphia TaxID=2996318 RepID=UPI001E6EB86D|nr:MAG: hypothetical protein LF884_06095 [Rickettsia endosymbiont of Cimex lectularius]